MAGSEPDEIKEHGSHGHNVGRIEPPVIESTDSDTTNICDNREMVSDKSEKLKTELDDTMQPGLRSRLRSRRLSLMDTNGNNSD